MRSCFINQKSADPRVHTGHCDSRLGVSGRTRDLLGHSILVYDSLGHSRILRLGTFIFIFLFYFTAKRLDLLVFSPFLGLCSSSSSVMIRFRDCSSPHRGYDSPHTGRRITDRGSNILCRGYVSPHRGFASFIATVESHTATVVACVEDATTHIEDV